MPTFNVPQDQPNGGATTGGGGGLPVGQAANYRIANGVLQVVDSNGQYRTVYFDANGVLIAGPTVS